MDAPRRSKDSANVRSIDRVVIHLEVRTVNVDHTVVVLGVRCHHDIVIDLDVVVFPFEKDCSSLTASEVAIDQIVVKRHI